MSMLERDASLIGLAQANLVQTVAGLRMVVDLPPALPEETWLVDCCSLYFFSTNPASGGFDGPSGLWLAPAGTQNVVTPPNSDNGGVVNQGLVPLPWTGNRKLDTTATAGGLWQQQCVPKEFIVPPNWFIRGIVDCATGAAGFPQPGDLLTILATYVRRKVCIK